MNNIKVSICSPTIRPHLWARLYQSLEINNVDWEIVFVGPGDWNYMVPGPKMKFIQSNVKPAQCYESAFRIAQGELIHWSTDDCAYDPNSLDALWKMYQEENNDKLVMEVRPIEDGREITSHTFKGGETPHMAPFGVVNREMFHKLGGYDRQFICGQSENDVVMRFIEIGGVVKTCQGAIVRVYHNEGHQGISVFRGGTGKQPGFYGEDRKVLEPLWITEAGMQRLTGVKAQDDQVDWSQFIRKTRSRPVDRFEDKDITTITQGQKGVW